MGIDGALFAATMVERLQLSNCRFLRSGSGGILVSRSENVSIAGNIVDKAATGIAVTNVAQGCEPALIQGNLVRNLFFRKIALFHGNGISIEADADGHRQRGGERVRVSASSWVAMCAT